MPLTSADPLIYTISYPYPSIRYSGKNPVSRDTRLSDPLSIEITNPKMKMKMKKIKKKSASYFCSVCHTQNRILSFPRPLRRRQYFFNKISNFKLLKGSQEGGGRRGGGLIFERFQVKIAVFHLPYHIGRYKEIYTFTYALLYLLRDTIHQ